MRNKGCVRLSVNHIGGVMINLLVSTAVDRGFCTGPTPLHSVLVPHHYTLYWFHITTSCIGSTSLHSVLVPHHITLKNRKHNWSHITTLCTGSTSLHSIQVPHHYTLYWSHITTLYWFRITTLCTGSASPHSVLVPHHYTLCWFRFYHSSEKGT
jgi:hypothetical protein